MGGESVFHVIDYCVLVGMMLISLAIGIYYAFSGGRQRTTKEYFMGNKAMGVIPITLSLLASFFSSNTLLGVPAEVYAFGFDMWYCVIGAALAMPFVGYWVMPVFYNLGISSTYEYLEMRFNRKVRLATSCFFILYLCVYAAFVTYGPALALTQVTNLNFWASVVTICIIGTVYTTIGGIKAVMWTDSLQMVVIVISMFIIVVKGLIQIGGFQELYNRNVEGQRLAPLSFSLDPRVRYSFWGIGSFSFLLWSGVYGMSQYQVQRYLSAPTIQIARRSTWFNLPGQVFVQTLVCFIGLLMYAKYWNCDPLLTKRIQALDQLFPIYVMDTLGEYPGLPGLFVAGIFSGSLSTTSSILNCLANIVLDDYIKPRKRWSQISDEKATIIAKFIAIFFGIFTIFMVFVVSVVRSDIVQASGTVMGTFCGTVYGVFFAAVFCPWITSTGALIGMFSGFLFSLWVGLGITFSKSNSLQKLPISDVCLSSFTNFTSTIDSIQANSSFVNADQSDIPQIYRISYVWNYVFCIMLIAIVGSIFSLFQRSCATYYLPCVHPSPNATNCETFITKLVGNHKYDRRLYSPLVNYIRDKILKRPQEKDPDNTRHTKCSTKEDLLNKEQML